MEFEIFHKVGAPPVAFRLRGNFIYKVLGTGGIALIIMFFIFSLPLNSFILIGIILICGFLLFRFYKYCVDKSKEDLHHDTKRFCRRNINIS